MSAVRTPVRRPPLGRGIRPVLGQPAMSVSRRVRPAEALLPAPACCCRAEPAHASRCRPRGRLARIGGRLAARPWRALRSRLRGDGGMTTAEYAMGTLAACAFAGLLYKVLTGGTVAGLLTGIVRRALSLAG